MQNVKPISAVVDTSDAVRRAACVRLMVFDIDGVLTDGRIHVGPDGSETHKSFYVLDGAGIKMLMAAQISVGVITGRTSSIVSQRCKELGIHLLEQGVKDKGRVLQEMILAAQLPMNACGYMGDDIIDLPAMRLAQFSATVPSAPDYVRQRADWVSQQFAGRGAARECCDFILQAQGRLQQLIEQGWH